MSQSSFLPADARHAQSLPEYSPLAELFLDAGAYLEVCELHGMLCGFICAGLLAHNTTWLHLLLMSAREDYRSQIEECVTRLFRISLEQLSSFSFDFEVFLPSTDEPQTIFYISKLSQWCECFLLALTIATPSEKPGSKNSHKDL